MNTRAHFFLKNHLSQRSTFYKFKRIKAESEDMEFKLRSGL